MSHATTPGMADSLVIPSRFSGPPGTGNGGYACGRIASCLDGPVTVTLRQPVPLATPMAVERVDESSIRIHQGPTLIAEAMSTPSSPALEIPDTVSLAAAHAVAGRARYYADPLFPDCFVCGMGRTPGDGLRIFPGPLPARQMWAAPWTPDPSVWDGERVWPEVVWAALDCPSGIAAADAAGLPADTAVLLGRMTASLAVLPEAGAECVVIAWPKGRDGRKLLAGSALLGSGGTVLAVASAVWLTVPRQVPVPAAGGVL
jgi:hypothetical protein